MKFQQVPEYIDGLPNISGSEDLSEVMKSALKKNVFTKNNPVQFDKIRSATAIALHMHQPLIPAGGSDLRTADLTST